MNKDFFEFGLNNKLARDSFEILEPILDGAKLLSNDPENFIHEFFSDLKNIIDLKKEEYVAKIEEKYEKMINQVLETEKECKLKTKNKTNDLEKMVQEIDNTLKRWNETLNQLDLSKDDEWKSIRFDAAKEIQKLEDEMEKCKNDLLLNTDFSFNPCIMSNEDEYFGDFNAENYESKKISMVVNNFSSFKSFKDEIESDKLIFKDLAWIIKAKADIGFGEFGLCFQPECVSEDDDYGDFIEKLKNDPTKTKLIFKIKQIEARRTFVKILQYHNCFDIFDEPAGTGFGFGSKEDIMNPLNGIYNKDTDSILVEVKIKFFN